MENYKVNGKYYEITLANGKIVKCEKEWAEKSMKALDTDLEDVLLMWLEDEGYIINEEQEELDKKAKGVVKPKAGDKTQRKPREKVQKENPTKELIIAEIAKILQALGVDNLKIENKAKLITFDYVNESFKVDLIQKRKPKN
jgi:hypothetical protein